MATAPSTTPATQPTTRPAVQEFYISIQPDKDKYQRGENISLSVTITNISQRQQQIGRTHPLHHYWVVLVDPEEQRVPLTEFGRGVFRRAAEVSSSWIRLEPGESHTTEISQINRMFDFTLPGEWEYKLWVERIMRIDPVTRQRLIIGSNEVVITVGE